MKYPFLSNNLEHVNDHIYFNIQGIKNNTLFPSSQEISNLPSSTETQQEAGGIDQAKNLNEFSHNEVAPALTPLEKQRLKNLWEGRYSVTHQSNLASQSIQGCKGGPRANSAYNPCPINILYVE